MLRLYTDNQLDSDRQGNGGQKQIKTETYKYCSPDAHYL